VTKELGRVVCGSNKARLQQEFVVGGFTQGKRNPQRLGALLLGAYRNGRLHYF
jgi:hypothetical protein